MAPALQPDDPIAPEQRVIAMRNAHDRDLQPEQIFQNPGLGCVIEVAGSLVEKQHLRLTDEAGRQFTALPVQAIESPRLKAVEARLHFAKALAGAPTLEELDRAVSADSSDLESVHQLAVREFTAGQVESALDRWLGMLRKNRSFGDGLARRSLLAAFTLLEGQDELVHRYRRQMMALLH